MNESKKPNLGQILVELKADYLAKFPERLNIIRDLVNHSNWSQVQAEFHKLKGNGQTLGFKWVSEISGYTELVFKNYPELADTKKLETARLAIELLELGLKTPHSFDVKKQIQWGELKKYGPNI